MKRFGVTTIARWLGEELPEGVRAYVECRGTLMELLGLVKMDTPRLLVNARPLNIPTGDVPRPLRIRVGKRTPVILSLDKNLSGVKLAELEGDLAPAASNSWAMHAAETRLKFNRGTPPVPNVKAHGLFCG